MAALSNAVPGSALLRSDLRGGKEGGRKREGEEEKVENSSPSCWTNFELGPSRMLCPSPDLTLTLTQFVDYQLLINYPTLPFPSSS